MKQRYTYTLLIFILFAVGTTEAQRVTYQTSDYKVEGFASLVVKDIVEDWNFRLTHFQEITEGNRYYRQHLMQLKEESALRFPRTNLMQRTGQGAGTTGDADVPGLTIKRNFQGNLYSNSVPNDNTVAVSNGDQLISAINTNVYFYDLKQDSLMKTLTLNAFSKPLTGISLHQYDPKLLYDPHQDRFILVFLAGASSDTKTNVVVGFTETNDMLGTWHMYSLPGNPLNDTSWTDYPAIALTEDELFITVNLLNYGTSWQTSFKQTVVWQVNKYDGYRGDSLSLRLWKDIAFDSVNIRNINPVQGGEHLLGPNIYLLSNRNFTLYSDSIFLMEITGNLKQENAALKIVCLKPEVGYGAPPDARQPNTTNVLATNDARVLGAFLHNNTIQFVANSIDTLTGGAAVYHGVITNVNHAPSVRGRILSEPGLEFGYPNISYSGNTLFSQQAIIGFNHTGDTTFPGVSAIFYDGKGGYSKRSEIKTGAAIISILPGNYERWGDYTGNQRKYNAPGTAWITGMFGVKQGVYMRLGTQIAELTSGAVEQPLVRKGRSMEASLYPNPHTDLFGMEFTLDTPQKLIIELRSLSGQRIHRFYEGEVNAGKSALSFSTRTLAQGLHLLVITDGEGKVLFTEKVLKTGN